MILCYWKTFSVPNSRNSTRKPLNLIKSPIFTNTPCKTACLYNAPSMHTLDHKFRILAPLCPSRSLAISLHASTCFGSKQKRPGAKGPPEFVPENLFQGVFGSPSSLQGNRGKTHTQNLQILREDTLGATCSAGPFCLLPNVCLAPRVGKPWFANRGSRFVTKQRLKRG